MICSVFDLRMFARNDPRLLGMMWKYRRWLPMMQRHAGQRRVVEPEDDVVIEGYFRSANTFAVESFAASQLEPVRIAHHFHSPAQFALARRYGVPAMLLLREPIPAALSYVIFNEGTWSAQKALQFYVDFHLPLLRIQEGFVVAPFEEVTSDFGKSIARLNARFGTHFKVFEHSNEAQSKVFAGIEKRMTKRGEQTGLNMAVRMNFPNDSKAQLRAKMKHTFEDPALEGLKIKANALYETLVALV
jgi:hypothetical protein